MRLWTSAVFRSAKWRDLWIMLAVLVLVWVPISELDLYEWFYDFSRAHEEWDLDETVVLILFLPLPLAWYSWRRMREAQTQTERLLEVERQLSHARKMDGLGTLAAGMAHQVNNQLQPVIGLSELIVVQTAADDPKLRQLEMIRDAALRARGSLDTVLRISRRDCIERDQINVSQNISDLVDMLSLSCPSDISFVPVIAAKLPTPSMPWDDLESVVMNLFSNAVAAIDGAQGSVTFTVTSAQVGANHRLILTLSDTGGGILAEAQDRIFEPYYTSKPVGQGTGLGLWQVQELLRNAGGHIKVDSHPGEGAQFEIWVPASYPPETGAWDAAADQPDTREDHHIQDYPAQDRQDAP